MVSGAKHLSARGLQVPGRAISLITPGGFAPKARPQPRPALTPRDLSVPHAQGGPAGFSVPFCAPLSTWGEIPDPGLGVSGCQAGWRTVR